MPGIFFRTFQRFALVERSFFFCPPDHPTIPWGRTDKEVLFDKKVKFRALHSGEKGYIKEGTYDDGFVHIALVEV